MWCNPCVVAQLILVRICSLVSGDEIQEENTNRKRRKNQNTILQKSNRQTPPLSLFLTSPRPLTQAFSVSPPSPPAEKIHIHGLNARGPDPYGLHVAYPNASESRSGGSLFQRWRTSIYLRSCYACIKSKRFLYGWSIIRQLEKFSSLLSFSFFLFFSVGSTEYMKIFLPPFRLSPAAAKWKSRNASLDLSGRIRPWRPSRQPQLYE